MSEAMELMRRSGRREGIMDAARRCEALANLLLAQGHIGPEASRAFASMLDGMIDEIEAEQRGDLAQTMGA